MWTNAHACMYAYTHAKHAHTHAHLLACVGTHTHTHTHTCACLRAHLMCSSLKMPLLPQRREGVREQALEMGGSRMGWAKDTPPLCGGRQWWLQRGEGRSCALAPAQARCTCCRCGLVATHAPCLHAVCSERTRTICPCSCSVAGVAVGISLWVASMHCVGLACQRKSQVTHACCTLASTSAFKLLLNLFLAGE